MDALVLFIVIIDYISVSLFMNFERYWVMDFWYFRSVMTFVQYVSVHFWKKQGRLWFRVHALGDIYTQSDYCIQKEKYNHDRNILSTLHMHSVIQSTKGSRFNDEPKTISKFIHTLKFK